MKSKISFTKTYGESYLSSALIISPMVYQKYKEGKRIFAKKLINEAIKKHNLKLTKKGKELLLNTIKNTMIDLRKKNV